MENYFEKFFKFADYGDREVTVHALRGLLGEPDYEDAVVTLGDFAVFLENTLNEEIMYDRSNGAKLFVFTDIVPDMELKTDGLIKVALWFPNEQVKIDVLNKRFDYIAIVDSEDYDEAVDQFNTVVNNLINAVIERLDVIDMLLEARYKLGAKRRTATPVELEV